MKVHNRTGLTINDDNTISLVAIREWFGSDYLYNNFANWMKGQTVTENGNIFFWDFDKYITGDTMDWD